MTSFLPEGYESLKTDKSYWKMKDMKDGDNRLRIVMKPIAGWLDWHDKKPVRYRPSNKPSKPYNPEKPIKAFWAFYVWDYAREGLYVLEISQSSLLKSLTAIANDADWGDFTKYDIKINKSGNGKETRYALTPLPHKPLSDAVQKALDRSPVRLGALYDGGDPWTDLESVEADEATGEINAYPAGSPFDTLKEHLEIDGIDSSHLQSYLDTLAEKKNQPVNKIVESALIPQILPKFKQKYIQFLSPEAKDSVAV